MKTFISTFLGLMLSTVVLAQVQRQLTGSIAESTTAARQTPNTAFGEKVNMGTSLVYSPGNPIGGIIVKGGKDSGGNLIQLTTNNSGEFEFTIKEAGDYNLSFLAPQGKSISEKGLKRSDMALATSDVQTTADVGTLAARPGSPIGGIVVKGGKNPGGSMITVTSNRDGELSLKGLEAGNYRFTVTAP
jgi:hypothetical protein